MSLKDKEWYKKLRSFNHPRPCAKYWMFEMSEEDREEFCQLSPKRQANLLSIPDRRKNRFIREHKGQFSINEHCNHILDKKAIVRQRKIMKAKEQIAKSTKRWEATKDQQHAKAVSKALDDDSGW